MAGSVSVKASMGLSGRSLIQEVAVMATASKGVKRVFNFIQ
ncbi:hypothetical protein FLA_1735 [Filimonas lacunae]|nr:hypothetical protein FLA_1735 [Filimonas lacunae]